MQWLYQELPTLVSSGIVPEETAKRLREHYGPAGVGGGKKWALLVLGILGAALIGAGVILLVAHNWDDLSRPTRVALAFAPLLAAIALAWWVLLRRHNSAPWREGTATYWALTIGSTISLVAQIYQIHGDTARFFLTWILLGLPIVYLLQSNVAACLYFIGTTAWAGCASWTYSPGTSLWYWGLLALAMPHMVRLWSRQPYQWGAALTGWLLALCLCVGAGFSIFGIMHGAWIGMYTGLLALMYLAGNRWFKNAPTSWQAPWQSVGALGLGIVALILTYEWPWKAISFYGLHHIWASSSVLIAANLVASLLPIAAVCVAGREAHAANWNHMDRVLVGLAPLCGVIGYATESQGSHHAIAQAVFNGYLFVLGLGTLMAGIRSNHLGRANAGLLALAALIVARFFDSDLSFVARGIAFIVVGAGFLTANVVMLRRKGAPAR